MKHYEGKAVVVTGAGGEAGIGRAIAIRLAQEGASVVVNDFGVSEDGVKFADMTVETIQSQGGIAVANYDSVVDGAKSIIQTCIDHFGKIDVLINNAGNHIFGSVLEGKMEDLDLMYNIHVKGMFSCAQEAAQQMVKQGHGGSIINFSSPSAFSGELVKGQQCTYGMVKAAILALTHHASYTLEEYGITVNDILPDAVSKINTNEGQAVDLGHHIPLPVSYRSPECVGAIVAYLASQNAIDKKVTGKHVYVAGADFVVFAKPFTLTGDDVTNCFYRNATGEPWNFDDLDSIHW